jgi:tRNA 2-selenouridine synthase
VKNYIDLLRSNRPLIDLRSPIEFAKGAFPQSINLPILTDDERAQVGKKYKHQGSEAAIQLGYKIVSGSLKESRVIAWKNFIENNPNSWMYCFRGGQRSSIAKVWLNEININISFVEGGFKVLRQTCIDSLDSVKNDSKRWIILGGRTGTGKTVILNKLKSSIDLEKHAEHRGSAFGGFFSPQPTSIDFENRLALDYLRHEKQTLILEDESRNIGRVALPNAWFTRMKKSELVILEISLDERVQNIIEDYVQSPLRDGILEEDLLISLRSSLSRIQKRLGGDIFKEIRTKIDKAILDPKNYHHEDWVVQLLNTYYDPLYDYQIKSKDDKCIYRSDTKGVVEFLSGLESDK